MTESSPDWHHAPHHVFAPNTFYMVTAGTLHKEHRFKGHDRLHILQEALFQVLKFRGWKLRAWALFSNHYHWIGVSPTEGSIRRLIQHLHSESAKKLNEFDHAAGRKVWFQYWDKCLTFEKSYFARLNYVINNPVHHGLVHQADQYPFCSAGWFKRHSRSAFQQQIASFKTDRLNETDKFQPVWRESGTKVPHSEK